MSSIYKDKKVLLFIIIFLYIIYYILSFLCLVESSAIGKYCFREIVFISSFRSRGLTVTQFLDLLDDGNEMEDVIGIVTEPPLIRQESDEDSEKEEPGTGAPNRLSLSLSI